MQFSEQWLRTWCNPDIDTKQLSNLLTMHGLEVEEILPVANEFNNIIIAQVIEVLPHPDADKLKICKVQISNQEKDEILQIVCGASNVLAGIKVPCAMIGAKLKLSDGAELKIKLGKLRGIESFGMLCSAKELGLYDNVDGLLILPNDAPIGENIREYLNLNDKLIVIKLTPNRADCLSIQGIARDLSAITNTQIMPLDIQNFTGSFESKHTIDISNAKNLCSRFVAREINNIDASVKTPDYIAQRLIRSGLRTVNILVDISNYVMLELGQPNHIFDGDILGNNIQVHWSDNNISELDLINNTKCSIKENTGIISDENGIQAIAGVMGGLKTSITTNTQNIFIECAFWHPNAIAGKTKLYKLQSDAAYRFERGVDPQLCLLTMDRISDLILKHCKTANTKLSFINDINLLANNPKSIQISQQEINKITGFEISVKQILDILTRINLKPDFEESSNNFIVKAPSYRFDINIKEDIIEEIIRLYGFDNIKLRSPIGQLNFLPQSTNINPLHTFRHKLCHLGYNEVINFSFTSQELEQNFSDMPSTITLKNPIAIQYEVMRSTLIGGLIEKLVFNQQHKAQNIRLFEVGKVFQKNSANDKNDNIVKNITENIYISALANGLSSPIQWGKDKKNIDFFDIKGDLSNLLLSYDITFVSHQHPACHPGRCASLYIGKEYLGYVGELHPKWQQLYDIQGNTIIFEINYNLLKNLNSKNILSINKYPFVKRDIAVIVKDYIESQQMINALYQLKYDTNWPINVDLFDIEVFDVFKPNEKSSSINIDEKSLALQFFVQNKQATLSEYELDTIMELAVKCMENYGRLRK